MNSDKLAYPSIKLDQGELPSELVIENNQQNEENQDHEQSSNSFKQFKMSKQDSYYANLSINQVSKTFKQNYLKKFFFNQTGIIMLSQTLLKNSYILQDKFANHKLLVEQYLNDQSMNIYNQINQIKSWIPIIRSNNIILQFWDVIKLLLYLILMWFLPFEGAFLIDQRLQIYEIVMYYLLVFDVCLKLNTEMIVEGQLVSDRTLILKHFLKNDFLFDLIYMILYTCITFKLQQYEVSQVLNIGFFFMNLKKFQECIQKYQESSISINDKINLIELFITILTLAHFMACIWFYIGTQSQYYCAESWILKFNLQNEQIFTQYFYSFYWAAATMATVGYGDITGQNIYEIICSTILIFFSSGIFAFSLNSMGIILNNINQSNQLYKRNLLLINSYMTKNQVNSQLQIKVRNYIQFYYQSSQLNQQKDVNIIIEQLSQNLKLELINDIRTKVIQNNQFISKYFSGVAQSQIIQQSETVNYTPLEQIYLQNTNEDHSLYIISKGAINLMEQNSGRIIQELKQGDSFGELEFLTEKPRYLSAYSVGYSQVLKISRRNFLEIIKLNQQDFEQFHLLKDQILFNLKSSIQCVACQDNHILFQCNKIFYKPDIQKVVKDDLICNFQNRQEFKRISQKKLFQLSDIKVIKNRCQAYRYDNDFDSLKSKELISLNQQFKYGQLQSKNYINKTSITQFKQISKQQSESDSEEDDQDPNKSKISANLNNLGRSTMKQTQNYSDYQSKISFILPRQQSKYMNTLSLAELTPPTDIAQDHNKFIKMQLDKNAQYIIYFPHNNINNVIKSVYRFNRESICDKSITFSNQKHQSK